MRDARMTRSVAAATAAAPVRASAATAAAATTATACTAEAARAGRPTRRCAHAAVAAAVVSNRRTFKAPCAGPSAERIGRCRIRAPQSRAPDSQPAEDRSVIGRTTGHACPRVPDLAARAEGGGNLESALMKVIGSRETGEKTPGSQGACGPSTAGHGDAARQAHEHGAAVPVHLPAGRPDGPLQYARAHTQCFSIETHRGQRGGGRVAQPPDTPSRLHMCQPWRRGQISTPGDGCRRRTRPPIHPPRRRRPAATTMPRRYRRLHCTARAPPSQHHRRQHGWLPDPGRPVRRASSAECTVVAVERGG